MVLILAGATNQPPLGLEQAKRFFVPMRFPVPITCGSASAVVSRPVFAI